MPVQPVFRPKPQAIEALFGRCKAVIGIIVASCLKLDSVRCNPVDPDRLRTFMREAGRASA